MSSTERSGSGTSASTVDDLAGRTATVAGDLKAGVEGAMNDATEKGREVLDGARDVRDAFSDAILSSVRMRPYTTLAIAALIGFAYGAFRRR